MENQDESWELLKYMCHGDGCWDFLRRVFRSTAMMKYNEDPWYDDNVLHWGVFREIMASAVPVNLSPVFEAFYAILKEAHEKALFHKETPEQAVSWAQEEGEKLLAEFWETHE